MPSSPFGEPPDVSAAGKIFCSGDDDQGELNLNNQEPQGEIITPSGETWEPPVSDDDGNSDIVQS